MALYFKSASPLMGIWKIEESVEELLALLDDQAWARTALEQFTVERRKQEWLAVRILLRMFTDDEKRIVYCENGKPSLTDSNLHVSITHTRGYAAILLSEKEHVGIDIEKVSSQPHRLRARFLSPEELSYSLDAEDIYFPLLAWSAKETAFKMLGLTEVDFREQLRIQPFVQEREGVLEIVESRSAKQGICRINYVFTDHYVLTYSKDYQSFQ